MFALIVPLECEPLQLERIAQVAVFRVQRDNTFQYTRLRVNRVTVDFTLMPLALLNAKVAPRESFRMKVANQIARIVNKGNIRTRFSN